MGQRLSAMRDERILVIEDEPMVAQVVERYLRRDGYDVLAVNDGDRALDYFKRFQPDLVLLDLMLPGMELCRQLRARSPTPVIMLTARGDELDKLLGLGLGADDYVTKPFSPRELAARLKAVLRRTNMGSPLDSEALRFGDLRINARTRSVEDGRQHIELTAREFDLLYYLVTRRCPSRRLKAGTSLPSSAIASISGEARSPTSNSSNVSRWVAATGGDKGWLSVRFVIVTR